MRDILLLNGPEGSGLVPKCTVERGNSTGKQNTKVSGHHI